MARLLTSGAETRDTTGAGGLENIASVSNVTVDTTTFRSGSASWKIDAGAGNSAGSFTYNIGSPTTNTHYYVRAYLRLSSLGTLGENLIKMFAAGVPIVGLDYNWDGTNGNLRHTANGFAWGSQTIVAGQWYRVELRGFIGTGAVDESELWIDGQQISIRTGQSFTDLGPQSVQFGYLDASGPGANIVMNLDDIAVNDSTGTDQNSWPGDGRQVLLLPISDNARATLWTGGVGGTTNLFDAVNNTPPIGTATETDLTQIEHAGGAAGTTDAYDANMTTPFNAGIRNGDTINAVHFLEADGEDVATGSKLLSFEVLSNPVIASPGNVTAGQDIGALGTYPTNWTARRSSPVYNPSLTVGTSPVMRVKRPETATRVASVCFMGMYVDYTPAPVDVVMAR